MILEEIFRAGGYLMIGGVIGLAFTLAKTAKGDRIEILWKGFLWCVAIGVFTSFTLGDPSCVDSETDNRGTTCYDYADDGFTPTTEQRAANFAYYMTLLFVPVAFGAFFKPADEIFEEKEQERKRLEYIKK